MDAASVQFGQYPPARRTLAARERHASARREPRRSADASTPRRTSRRTLDAVERLGIRPDAIVFTGDLTDLGEPEAYRGAARGGRARRGAARRADRLGRRQSRRAPGAAPRPARPRADAGARHRRVGPRRPAPHRARHDGARAGTTATSTSDQLDWLRGILSHAGAARHDPRDAPPAAAVARPAVRHPRAARPGPPRRGDRRHRRARRSSPATCTTRRAARSRASP